MACYKLTIEELRVSASTALGIDVPDTPVCAHIDEYNIEVQGGSFS